MFELYNLNMIEDEESVSSDGESTLRNVVAFGTIADLKQSKLFVDFENIVGLCSPLDGGVHAVFDMFESYHASCVKRSVYYETLKALLCDASCALHADANTLILAADWRIDLE